MIRISCTIVLSLIILSVSAQIHFNYPDINRSGSPVAKDKQEWIVLNHCPELESKKNSKVFKFIDGQINYNELIWGNSGYIKYTIEAQENDIYNYEVKFFRSIDNKLTQSEIAKIDYVSSEPYRIYGTFSKTEVSMKEDENQLPLGKLIGWSGSPINKYEFSQIQLTVLDNNPDIRDMFSFVLKTAVEYYLTVIPRLDFWLHESYSSKPEYTPDNYLGMFNGNWKGWQCCTSHLVGFSVNDLKTNSQFYLVDDEHFTYKGIKNKLVKDNNILAGLLTFGAAMILLSDSSSGDKPPVASQEKDKELSKNTNKKPRSSKTKNTKTNNYQFGLGDLVFCYKWEDNSGYQGIVMDRKDGKYLIEIEFVDVQGWFSLNLEPLSCSGNKRLHAVREYESQDGKGSLIWVDEECLSR